MRKVLGRGLDALLQGSGNSDSSAAESVFKKIPLDKIRPNRLQPRKNFDAERLSELAQSLKEQGLAQPISVSFDPISNSYELIAGERRLRAAKLAGWESIDAVVKQTSTEKHRLALALVENIQRDDLNAIETALAYKKLMTEHSISQNDLGAVVGKSRSAVANTLRLLDLPDEIQKAIQFERIKEGHARALLMVRDPIERNQLFKRTLDQELSVRKVEEMAQILAEGRSARGPKAGGVERSSNIEAMEKRLEKIFGTKVQIKTKINGKSGKISIHFYSLDDFDKIINIVEKK